MANDYKPRTAQDAAARLTAPLATDAESKAVAAEAGLVSAAYVDYEKALKNYESRSDVETLEQRLARENGGTFKAASFVREVSDEEESLEEARKNEAASVEFSKEQAAHTAEAAENAGK